MIIIKLFNKRYLNKITRARYFKFIIGFFLFIFSLVVIEYFYFQERAPLGTFIGESYVGGKTYGEIETILKEMKENMEREMIYLYPDQEDIYLNYSLAEIGITIEQEKIIEEIRHLNQPFNYLCKLQTALKGVIIPGLFKIKSVRFESVLAEIKKGRCFPPEDAEIWAEEGVLKYRPHKIGKSIDEKKLSAEILQRLYHWPSFPLTFQLETEVLFPARKISDIMNMGIKDKIVTFSTFFDDSSLNRNHNISLAAKALDNILLSKGKIFSFNELVGEASLSSGYREAPIIVNEELVMGPGGGICQVSSTIYNAALLSGLAIEERHHHSIPVTYLPPGLDATIAYNYLDLRFRNNLPFHVLIHMQVLGNELRAIFFGDPSRSLEVEVITRKLSSIPPPVHYRELSDKPSSYREIIQAGREGFTVETIRIFFKDGVEISRESLGQDHYAPRPEIRAVGVLSEE
ncbi:MAG: VanW family protein [Dethiobacteria bacterium]